MKFSDLTSLVFNRDTEIIDIESIVDALPRTPVEVAQQLYADHGRKHEFQEQYGQLEISQISWNIVQVNAAALAAVSMNENFRRWFTALGERAANVQRLGWDCIDSRANVKMHWQEHKTWLLPPVVFSSKLVGSKAPLHLAEGHTRVGLLTGLVCQGVLAPNSVHNIWLGS